MAGHTPGPWKIERGDFNPSFGGIVADVKVPCAYASGRSKNLNYSRVAIKAYDVQHRDEPPASAAGEANARLIAAAPELLAACRFMAAVLQGFTAAELKKRVGEIHAESFDEAQGTLWSAIEKAAGREEDDQ